MTLTANEGMLPFLTVADEAAAYGDNNPEYNTWFRAKVQEALDDSKPSVPNEEAKMRMAKLRDELLSKAS